MANEPESPQVLTYILDDESTLISVGGEWDRFAVENGASDLVPPRPLWRPMRSFISDETTVQLYDAIYDKARRTGRPFSFPLRCDSPDLRRELRMTILYTNASFFIRSVLLSVTKRPPMPIPVALRVPGDSFLRACGWCKRLDAGGRWVEIEEAVTTLALFHESRLPEISHGICDDCLARMEGLLAAP